MGRPTPYWLWLLGFYADTADSAKMIKGLGESEEQSTEFWMCELVVKIL